MKDLDEIRKMLGVEWGPRLFKIEEGMIKKFEDVVGYHQSLSDKIGVMAPPGLPVCMELEDQTNWVAYVECGLPNALNAGVEHEYFRPIRPGDVISVTGKLIDIKEREGKTGPILFLTCERYYKNQNGDVVCKAKLTYIRR